MGEKAMLPVTWNLPLSGAVTQSFAMPFSGGGFSLLSVNVGDSGDAGMERAVIEKVGSYGRQLGRICDAVEALVKTVEGKNLTKEDERALHVFADMAAAIRHTKAGGTATGG